MLKGSCGKTEVYFYGITGQKLVTATCVGGGAMLTGVQCVLRWEDSEEQGRGGGDGSVGERPCELERGNDGISHMGRSGPRRRKIGRNSGRTRGIALRRITRTNDTMRWGWGGSGRRTRRAGVSPGTSRTPGIDTLYVHGDPVNFKRSRRGLNEAEADDDDYYDEDHPFSGGGGAGPGWDGGDGSDSGHAQAFYKAATTLWKALDLALTKLDSDKCRSLFGNDSSPDPRDVLKGLLYGNPTSKYGMVTVDDIPDDPGKVTSATTKVTGLKPIDIGNGATQLVNGTVLITINDLAGDFANGDVRESGPQLFFHELGHAYYDLSVFLGGSPITPDGGDVTKSQANQALIKKNCF